MRKLKVKIAKVSPGVAATLLDERNTHNRGVDRHRVGQYAADMRAGRWQLNGEAIKIAHDGTILDGQHRLLGIVESGATVEMLLVIGLDPSSQESMDQAKPRGFHDALRLRGEKDPNVLAAATKLLATYERDGVPFAQGFAPAVSNQTAAATLDEAGV